jgi:hypothetical protein
VLGWHTLSLVDISLGVFKYNLCLRIFKRSVSYCIILMTLGELCYYDDSRLLKASVVALGVCELDLQ